MFCSRCIRSAFAPSKPVTSALKQASRTDASRTNPSTCKGRHTDIEPATTISAILTNPASARSQTNYLQTQPQSTKAETWIPCAVKDENRQARIIAPET
ncbi:hypothetical protein D0869_02285 [Hortaea werneckii]|uniref:Uncharacterized protein n=1 Tax=Hortaea werneckii TaxID=91943 RepID=A0A3M6X9U5_HORWE|nr:hypothetical protein D0869_02285 [Hortaea werneckii]